MSRCHVIVIVGRAAAFTEFVPSTTTPPPFVDLTGGSGEEFVPRVCHSIQLRSSLAAIEC